MGAKGIVLGLNAVGFNTSTSLIRDGRLVFAVEEERLVRDKRTRRFPAAGIQAALDWADLRPGDVERIAVSWNPAINLEAHSAAQSGLPRYLPEMLYSIPSNLMRVGARRDPLMVSQRLTFGDGGPPIDVDYQRHHECHAAAAFLSPFEESAVLTVDGFGEAQCATISKFEGETLSPLWEQNFPQSLGALYSAFTSFCGFKPQSDEWKLMGAAPYGDPTRFRAKVSELVRIDPSGGFELDLSVFEHYQFHRPGYFNSGLAAHLGVAPRLGESEPLAQVYRDIAAAAQAVFEDVYLHLVRLALRLAGSRRLVIAGGSALNSVANGKVASLPELDRLFVPPVPDDSGAGTGAALLTWTRTLGRGRPEPMAGNYLGPGFDEAAIKQSLDGFGLAYARPDDIAGTAAGLIADGKVIGWFQGRLEFGDRALGNRSILADPRRADMKDRVNALIKYREGFRPFAPAILAGETEAWFQGATFTQFMERVFPIRPERRDTIPAVVHVDGSGRLQTVSEETNPLFHALISAFRALTGVPVLLNTSFNLRGEPIVCRPEDAIRTFHTSGLDALCLGPFLLEKNPTRHQQVQ